MISGETFNENYSGYEEASYDYHFKRKGHEAGGQKKPGKKLPFQNRKPGKFIPKPAGKKPFPGTKKSLIKTNFGLFNKNKKKEASGWQQNEQETNTNPEAENASPEVNPASPERSNTSDAPTVDEANQNQAVNNPTNPDANNASDNNQSAAGGGSEESPRTRDPENPEQGAEGSERESESDYESEYDEPTTKPDTKTNDKAGQDKKSGGGAWIGWTCLGITFLLVGYALLSSDKKSKEILPPFKTAA
ncbi:MAG: hypothetical protein JST26_05555 [Bacteroidetes bacterium]|nr:hypothetical protein [Bacteroidota bacterium]